MKRRAWGSWLAAPAAAWAGAGCMFVADLGQFDGATTRSADAAVPLDGESPSDAGLDTTTEAADAAPDTGLDGADAAGWCASHTTPGSTLLCRDFDDGSGYLAGWSMVSPNPDFGSISDTVAFTPPNSMLLTTTALDTGSAYDQFTEFLSFANGVDLQFQLQIPDFDKTAGDLSLCRVAFQNSQWWVSLDLSGAGASIFETIAGDGGVLNTITHSVRPPTLAAGTWVNVDLTVNWVTNTVTLAYDGTRVTSFATSNPPPGATFSVQVGVNYLGAPAQPMHLYYDDVLLNSL